MNNLASSQSAEKKNRSGLEGVVATSSSICHIDGEQGVLAYCGYDIHALAQEATFEEVAFLLWHRRLPTRAELGDVSSQLVAARSLPESFVRHIRNLPSAQSMHGLRTLVSMLAHYDPDVDDFSKEAAYRKAVRLTGQVAAIVAACGRMSAGGGLIEADPALSHAANFLLMLTGERPSRVAARAFDVALILHADHELNASTFAARVTAATLSDIHSAVVSGIGALKGRLHGGANTEVMKLLLSLGQDVEDERIDTVIRSMLERNEKVPGFGHRVYRTEDPRATHLRKMSKEVGERINQKQWFKISQRIETVVKEERQIDANVDFYSASTYYQLGIPTELFTPVFAVSRIVGWTAHILEQYENNRLIRPRAEYIGREYPQVYVPLERR